jgi:AcrR family transcriptional regulator
VVQRAEKIPERRYLDGTSGFFPEKERDLNQKQASAAVDELQVPTFSAGTKVSRGGDLRQDRAVRTRALILRCAAEVFAKCGYLDTSMKDVADRIGMTKGAVYFHFPDKEALATAVVEELYLRWPNVLATVQAKELPPFDAIIDMFDQAAVAFCEDPIVQGGTRLQNERASIDVELPKPYLDWINVIHSLMRDAAAEGQLKEGVDPAVAARVAVSAFFGAQHISANLNDRADWLERWAEVRDLLFPALWGRATSKSG